MAEEAAAAPPAPAPAKAKKAAKPKKPATHPKTSVMIVAAVKDLKNRKGSSLAAIKKHIAANNKVDIAKLNPFIKKGIKSLVEKKVLIQVKGSFKLGKEEKPKKKKVVKKKPAKKTAKKKTARNKDIGFERILEKIDGEDSKGMGSSNSSGKNSIRVNNN